MLLDGKALSDKIKEELAKKVKGYLVKPCLAVIQIGNDEASNIYIKAKEKACDKIGINFIHVKFESDVNEQEVINKIVELNNDNYVNGILLQLPIPPKFNQYKLLNLINKNKDVDGLTDINAGLLFKGNNNFEYDLSKATVVTGKLLRGSGVKGTVFAYDGNKMYCCGSSCEDVFNFDETRCF